ncbi:type II secretion system ATPase GspE [bacterium]|nr:type II secretion system ATPase GspE [bacterium]
MTVDTALPNATGDIPVKRPSFSFAKRHGVMVDGADDDAVNVIARPDVSLSAAAELRRFLGRPVRLTRVDAAEFDRRLQLAYETKSGGGIQMEGFDSDDMDLSSAAEALAEPKDLLESDDDAPIIRLINALLSEAVKDGASDIHVEPFESRLTVRFRVDGVLREVLAPPRAIAPLLASRIKVMAKLDIAEKRLPQDGRISIRIAGRPVDVRVSTIPSGHGERVVMRLLDKQAGRLDLKQLGLLPQAHQTFANLIRKPHGIILVTGPTGSGKTTTLYAGLGEINDRSRNIMTVEDPIEYYIDGIGQTQVNTKVDMSFARGLRAILRQDPDVVMVGEIRDLETAEIAVQSSLTGHLVLSTLHTNSAVGAVARLRDMGVEPFLLASSLIGLMAQRLVRTLCPHCKIAEPATEPECDLLGADFNNPPTIYHAKGCEECRHTGYLGRSGIHELAEVDETMRTMIHDGASEQALEMHARKRSAGIRQSGIEKVRRGETTLEEVLRVTQDD